MTMLKTTNNIIRKLTAVFLALVIAVGLLPAPALAAETSPPDWNFLVLFAPMDADYEEDGVTKHIKTSISDEEVKTLVSQLVDLSRS